MLKVHSDYPETKKYQCIPSCSTYEEFIALFYSDSLQVYWKELVIICGQVKSEFTFNRLVTS